MARETPCDDDLPPSAGPELAGATAGRAVDAIVIDILTYGCVPIEDLPRTGRS
jgi:hypothetical protein